MDLFKNFINKLQRAGYSLRDVRFFGAEIELRCRLRKLESINKFCKENSINQGSFYHMLSGKRPLPLDIMNILKIEARNYKCLVSGGNIPIKIPNNLTPELAYLVGVFRDGTIVTETSKNGVEYTCALYSKHKEFVETLKKVVECLFEIKTEIKPHGNIWGLRIRSLTLYLFLRLCFDAKQRQKYWDTPNLIKNSCEKIKNAYIAGFWDAEGGCPHLETFGSNIGKKDFYISFFQKNKESLEFIKSCLEERGIECGNIYWNQRKWLFKIKRKYINRFIKFIQTRHIMKIKRLKLMQKLLSKNFP